MPWISWNISAVDEFAPFASTNPHRPPIVLETVALNCLSYMYYVQRERGGDDAFIAALWSDCSLLTSVRVRVRFVHLGLDRTEVAEGGREGGREEELFEGEKRAWAGKLAQKCRF